MELYNNQYYHIYNRTNNDEALYRSRDNYIYFLKKYRYFLESYFDTIAYCLMPTHFHFLVKVVLGDAQLNNKDVQHLRDVGHLTELKQPNLISNAMKTLQCSYTKAINKMYNRHGSLFQSHYKARFVDDDKYLVTLLTYIHQNPVRTKLVRKAEDWEFSSYQDYIDIRKGTLPNKELVLSMIRTNELIDLTNSKIDNIENKYWV